MAKSVEEQVEEWAKKSLDDCGVRHFFIAIQSVSS